MRSTTTALSLLILLTLAGCATTGGPAGHATPGVAVGVASFYSSGPNLKTASGEVYDKNALTAAHPTLPFGTRVRVTHLRNHRSLVVRINDRGPFKRGRIIDVSRRAARELGFAGDGIARVRVEVLGPDAAALRSP